MIPDALRRLVRRLDRVLITLGAAEDPWARLRVTVPARYYGATDGRDLADYLRGESTVPVSSLEDVLAWLAGCAYERDPMRGADWTCHPFAFEYVRRGSCLDHALWAWRKLVDLGYDADLVVGRANFEPQSPHAWVVFRRDNIEYLLEAVPQGKHGPVVVQPVASARARYVPEFGVDRTGRRFAFAGYFHVEKAELEQADSRAETRR